MNNNNNNNNKNNNTFKLVVLRGTRRKDAGTIFI